MRPFKSAQNGARIQAAALAMFEALSSGHPVFQEHMEDFILELGLPLSAEPADVWMALGSLDVWFSKPTYAASLHHMFIFYKDAWERHLGSNCCGAAVETLLLGYES
jgi:hypothetical protein